MYSNKECFAIKMTIDLWEFFYNKFSVDFKNFNNNKYNNNKELYNLNSSNNKLLFKQNLKETIDYSLEIYSLLVVDF